MLLPWNVNDFTHTSLEVCLSLYSKHLLKPHFMTTECDCSHGFLGVCIYIWTAACKLIIIKLKTVFCRFNQAFKSSQICNWCKWCHHLICICIFHGNWRLVCAIRFISVKLPYIHSLSLLVNYHDLLFLAYFGKNVAIYALCRILGKGRNLRALSHFGEMSRFTHISLQKYSILGTKNYSAPLISTYELPTQILEEITHICDKFNT